MRSSTKIGNKFFYYSLLLSFLLFSLGAIAQPTTQATNLVFNNGGSNTSLNISWANGNGSNRLVVMTASNGVFTPVNGTDYTLVANDVNSNYSTANDKDAGAGVAKLVYAGTGTSVNVTGLTANTHYRVRIYEFAAVGFLYNATIATGSFQGVWFYTNQLSAGAYTVPVGASSLTVKAWGGGAGGGDADTNGNGAPGGGGGAYASSSFASVAGAVHAVTIGVGGTGGDPNGGPLQGVAGGASSFGTTVIAAGGSVVNGGVTGAAGGQASASTGTIKFSGGNGGNGGAAANQGGGGGGSSATSAGNGVDGGNFSGNQGGSFGDGTDGDGGEGGDDDGATSPNTAGAGTFPGGGGGGRGDANGASGAGASGLIIVSYEVDNTPPTTLQVGTVTATGGNIVSGYYNNTNTGISIDIPLNNDPTLVGGTIQIRINDDVTAGFNDVGGAFTIPAANTTQTVTLTEAQLAATSEFANPSPDPIDFEAIVTDAAGNSTTYTVSLSTITRDEAAPAAPSVPDLIAASDTGSSSTDNITNDQTPTFDVNGNTAGVLLEILGNGSVIATAASATGSVEQLTPGSNLAENVYTIAARATNITTGSQTSSANMSPNLTVDITPPTAPQTPDLTSGTDSGASNSDNLTNDNTPTFQETTSNLNVNGQVITINSSLDGNLAPTATVASNDYTVNVTTVMSDGTHTITATTSDVAGNVASSGSISVTIDTAAPDMALVTSVPVVAGPTTGTIARTGTITCTTGGASVTGVGTAFTTELVVGAQIKNASGNLIGTVQNIADDTNLTLAANAAVNVTAGNYNLVMYYTVTFPEPMQNSTITAADFSTSGATGTIALVTPLSPVNGASTIFIVSVNPITTSGNMKLDKTATAASDAAGNSTSVGFTGGTTAAVDVTGPAVTLTRPAGSSFINDGQIVTYTIGETITSGTITYTRTSGTADGNSPHVINLTGAELTTNQTNYTLTNNFSNALVNGTVYSVAFSATDALGNVTTVTNTGVTFDTSPPAQPATFNATTLGGNIVANFWNSHNTGVRLPVTIPNSGDLLGGSVIVEARISSGSFATIATTTSASIGTINTTKNIDIDATAIQAITGYAQGVQLQFQVKFIDQAGNIGATFRQSTNSLTVDTVVPAMSGTPTFALNGASRETIVFTFTEAIALANGVLPVRTITNGNPGFYSDQPFIRNSAAQTFYTTVGNTVTLSSDADGQWTSSVNITYTSDVGTAGNYIRDAAGNEMATVTFAVTTPAPLIQSSMVLNPNGGSGEIITFSVDQTLTTPTTLGAVTGITVNGSNTGFTATYNTTGNTITLAAAANNTWTETATVSYSGGNLTNGTAMAAFGPEPILLGPVTFTSNNANNAYAKDGDIITLAFRANSALSPAPTTVTIGGQTVSVTGSAPNYSAQITTPGGLTPGNITFSITAAQTNRTTQVTLTTNSSGVIYDNAAPATPTVPNLKDAFDSGISNTDNTTSATILEFDGTAEANSTVKLYDGTSLISTVTADGAGLYDFININLAEGFHNLTATATDAAGNASGNTAVLKVKVDTTPPVALISSIVASTGAGANQTSLNGIGITQGINGSVPTDLYFKVTFLEEVYDVATSDFTESLGSGASVLTSGILSVTADVGNDSIFYVQVGNAGGTGTYTIDFKDNGTVIDLAGNPSTSAGAYSNPFSGTNYFTLALPEPTSEAFTVVDNTITGNSITIEWPSTNTAQVPTHFLAMIKPTTGGSYPAVNDGTPLNNSDSVQNVIRVFGTNTATFTGLKSGTNYDFIVYKYTLASNNSNDNINYETSSPSVLNNILTTTASLSYITANTTPVPISSLSNSSGGATSVFSFNILDDGQNPLAPNAMNLWLNGGSPETIIFTLRDELTLAEGATVPGFSTSTGSIATAIYTGKGSTNRITLTSFGNGVWSPSTTVTYNGTLSFVNLGRMQPIVAHPVQNIITQTFFSNGTFTVPAGVTQISVEAWGGGGSGGGYNNLTAKGGGGGGGGYSRSILTVVPTSNYGVTVGLGQTCCSGDGQPGFPSSFGGGLVVANGGGGGIAGDGGGAGGFGAPLGTGDIRFNGGAGANGLIGSGGGGGSSAGSGANGNNGNSSGAPGVAPLGGGSGGAGVNSGAAANGFFPGGGGGGTGTPGSGSFGANGQVIVSFPDPNPIPTPTDWDGDNAPFKFSQLVINQGLGNSGALANWQNIIAGAELFDGTNTTAGTINPTNITFAAIPSTTSLDVGFVSDATTGISSKTYNVRVWLRTDLSNVLANSVDGLNLAFRVDGSGFTYNDISNGNQRSSRLVTLQPILQSGGKTIDVQATKLVYQTPGVAPINTNPQSQIGVGMPFSASAAQEPQVYALDANNNRDLGYNASVNISNPTQAFGQSITSASFVNGLLSLDPFFFTTGSSSVLNTQIVVTETSGPAVADATSTNVAAIISNKTTISAGASGEPATFSSLRTALSGAIAPQLDAIDNFDFTLTDDAATDNTNFTDNDGLPTLVTSITIVKGSTNDNVVLNTWTDAIASAELSDGTNTMTGVVGAANIVFSSIPTSSGTLGYIADGLSKTYTLRIALKQTVTGIADQIDGANFEFRVSTGNLNIGAANTTSVIQAAQAEESGDGLNEVEVAASQLDLLAPLVDQNYDADFTYSGQEGQYKARDVNGNLDSEFTFPATVGSVDQNLLDARTYPEANETGMSFTSGLMTLNSNLRILSTGNGFNGDDVQIRVVSNGITSNSNIFKMNYSGNSDIAVGTFAEPTNILYANANNQVTNITSGTGTTLQVFNIRDGGGSNDADGSATTLGSITLNITNSTNIRRLALYNSNGDEVIDVAPVFDASNNVILSNLEAGAFKITAADNSSTTFSVKVSFNSIVTDNQVLNVRVVAATAAGVSSSFNPAANSTTFPTLATDANQIEVVATQIDFTTIPVIPILSASISVPVTPQVGVYARDGNTSVDLDYNGTITAVSNTIPGSFNTINNPSGSFSSGFKLYPANFQFDIGNGNVALTIDAGPGSGGGVNAGALSGTSNIIKVESSFETVLASGFQTASGINYEDFQNPSMANDGEGFRIESLRLSDGLPINSYADTDGANSVLDHLQLAISNPQSIRTIAIFKNDPEDGVTTKVTETSTITASGFGYGTVDFTGLNITAEDKDTPTKLGYIDIFVVATFKDDTANIVDNKRIKVAVLDADLGVGSKFPPAPLQVGTFIGGIAQTTITLPDGSQSISVGAIGATHFIDVVATSLDFERPFGTLSQPSAYAGKLEPIDGRTGTSPGGKTGIVYARDKFGVLDVDFNEGVTVTADANPDPATVPSAFNNGVLNLLGMQYQNAGDGTLNILADGGLDSDVAPAPQDDAGNHTPSAHVDVFHVTATNVIDNTIEQKTSLNGGKGNVRIFGVQFSTESNYKTLDQPALTSFSIIFRNDAGQPYPYKTASSTIFKNFKLHFKEGNGTVNLLGPGTYTLIEGQSGALSGSGAPVTSKDKLTFNLAPANYGRLFANNVTYYLTVDVDLDVNVGTPAITPWVVDNGYGTTGNVATNGNIMTSLGSSSATVTGITRKFASTKPPELVHTYPANGQLNVNPNLDSIVMTFDVPVTTFDHQIVLYERASGDSITTLVATPGNGRFPKNGFFDPKLYVTDSLVFKMPAGVSLIPDSVYFVRVAKGRYSAIDTTDRKGISDEGFNLFGGISYSGDFFFKAASPNPPKIVSTNSDQYFYTATAGAFNLEFDQQGTLYYMIVDEPAYTLGTGTITTTITSPIVNGSGTSFTTQLVVGSYLKNSSGTTIIGQIASIQSNTQLTLVDNAAINGAAISYRYSPNSNVNNNQILGTVGYSASNVVARDSVKITQISPSLQWISFNAQLNNQTPYRVYVFAKSNAEPTPKISASPYGSQYVGFSTSGTGSVNTWTTTLLRRNSNSNPVFGAPNYEVCANSSVSLNQPIIISEPANLKRSFAKGGYGPNTTQTFNLLLPTGFQFDVTKTPDLKFNGTDFKPLPVGTANYEYVNNSILEVRFRNSGNATADNIIISGLYVTANASDAGGAIRRYYGVGLDTVKTYDTLALINGKIATTLDFTNTYNYDKATNTYSRFDSLLQRASTEIDLGYQVTYIPDNHTEGGESLVRLIPLPKKGDYGPTSFSGPGVTGDELVLSAVEKDASFFVTVTHTDMAGCKSTDEVQYLVYDHTNTISQLLKKPDTTSYRRYYIDGTKIGLIPGTVDNNNIPGPPNRTISSKDSVSYVGIAGYQLISLFAGISESTRGTGQVLDYDNPNLTALVDSIPYQIIPSPDDSIYYSTSLNILFKNYRWEYRGLINPSNAALYGPNNYPYDPNNTRFSRTVISNGTANTKTYFDPEGKSIGVIDFTGVYQSTADPTVFVPFKQSVEVFIPAVPLVEAVGNTDMLGDTLIYCENGGPFTITGYPKATPGLSKGKFKLRDAADTTIVISPAVLGGFIDNGNGTAIFNPADDSLKHKYQTILVEYTYQEDISPAIGTGRMYLKVTPKPIPSFAFTSKYPETQYPNMLDEIRIGTLSEGRAIDTLSYCEDNTIKFKNTSRFLNPTLDAIYSAKFAQRWNMGAPNLVNNEIPTQADVTNNLSRDSVYFTYPTFGRYDVTFSAESQYKCQSGDTTISVYVGVIPTIDKLTISGLTTGTPVTIAKEVSVSSGAAYPQSVPQAEEWYYGQSTPWVSKAELDTMLTADLDALITDPSNTNTYSRPGHYKLAMLQRTDIQQQASDTQFMPGCEIMVQRDIIILPSAASGEDNFNARLWQVDDGFVDSDTVPIVAIDTLQKASWQHGEPNHIEPKDGSGWYTNYNDTTGSYLRSERSYLYSPLYSLSGMTRPMVSFEQFTQMAQNDAVVLDFSIDNKNVTDPSKKWFRLGTNGDGVDWYNRSGLASKPGSQLTYPDTLNSSGDYGWTLTLLDTGKWVNSRHTLAPDVPANSNVVFRFTLASNGGQAPTKGFALDNFRIGERTRVVLVESFVNTGNTAPAEKAQADFLIADFNEGGPPVVTAGVDYVKLNYHTSFPAADPFNLDNSTDPSGRAQYYNISSTPISRMDGKSGAELTPITTNLIKDWGKAGFDRQTLDLARAAVEFVSVTSANGQITAEVRVAALGVPGFDSLKAIETVLHVVVAERGLITLGATPSSETNFEYVVKKMLPTASGTKLPVLRPGGVPYTETLSWFPENLKAPAGDLVVIAFVQNAETKEVYQAAMFNGSLADPLSTITGIEDIDPEKINFYPNPADDVLNVVLPVPADSDIAVVLGDQMGRITHNSIIRKGEQALILSTGNNSSGVYILQLDLGNGKLVRKKIIVTHKE